MKKYKIITPYPGSKNFGEEVYDWEIPSIILNDPLFDRYYKEVIEKDYEILSWEYNNKIFSKLNKKTNLEKGYIYCEEGTWMGLKHLERVSNKEYKINSVKRISDGEIFSVGDKYQVLFPIKEIRTIGSFHISDNTLLIHPVAFGYSFLKDIKKVKKPILTTEDGSDIYIGDDLYCVKDFKCKSVWNITFVEKNVKYFFKEKNAIKYIKANKVLFTTEDGVDIKIGDSFVYINGFDLNMYKNTPFKADKHTIVYSSYKYFSSKEYAEKYILMNKPCLRLEDARRAMNMSSIPYNYLKEIAKNKLKL